MATLERREQTPGNVSYRVRWWADEKQRSKSFKSYEDARRFKAVLEGDMVNGSFIDPKNGLMTVKSFIDDNMDTLTRNLRLSTRVRIEGIYRTHIIPEFGHLPLTAVTTQLVESWVNKTLKTHGSASVRKNAHALRKVLDLALSYGFLRANTAALVALPAEPKHEQKYLDQEQVMTLAAAISPRFRAMVLVAVFGGMRLGEICGLQRQHINQYNNTITVKQTLVEVGSEISFGPPKTKTSVRTVTLPRSIMDELVAHMDNYVRPEPDALLFTGEKGQPIRRTWFYRYYYQRATIKAGLDGLRFHDLRHTFVALWVSLGRNPKEVSKAAGHSSVAFTLDRYGHLYETDHDGLADELDTMLGLSGRIPQVTAGHMDSRNMAQNRPRAAGHSGGGAQRNHPKPFHGGSTGSNPVGGAFDESPGQNLISTDGEPDGNDTNSGN